VVVVVVVVVEALEAVIWNGVHVCGGVGNATYGDFEACDRPISLLFYLVVVVVSENGRHVEAVSEIVVGILVRLALEYDVFVVVAEIYVEVVAAAAHFYASPLRSHSCLHIHRHHIPLLRHPLLPILRAPDEVGGGRGGEEGGEEGGEGGGGGGGGDSGTYGYGMLDAQKTELRLLLDPESTEVPLFSLLQRQVRVVVHLLPSMWQLLGRLKGQGNQVDYPGLQQ